jgi:tripeptide aminopeptidase
MLNYQNKNNSLQNRFAKYVQIDTQSDPTSATIPSTEKQKNLGKVLVAELLEMGVSDAHLDEFGYVYATIPSNTEKNVPVICFCSHMDTSPDCSGTNVKPIIHANYQGQDLILPDDESIVLKTRLEMTSLLPAEQHFLVQIIRPDWRRLWRLLHFSCRTRVSNTEQ